MTIATKQPTRLGGLIMTHSFASQLSETIGDLGEYRADEDLAAILSEIGRAMATVLRDGGERMADELATEAVLIACRRDGIANEAAASFKKGE